ncbi:hypothetical protein, partial [Bradyrhizobium zhanjiangense]|uniref:hypothetical protein n=1 Tax=Bradyrhizobium zhanjiangense TaxID=1325107 RepID=UPI0019D6CDC7
FLESSQSPSRKRTFADSRPDAPQHCEKCGLGQETQKSAGQRELQNGLGQVQRLIAEGERKTQQVERAGRARKPQIRKPPGAEDDL